MWVMYKKGFISVVQHRDDPEMLIVRSRVLAHLADFFGFNSKDDTELKIFQNQMLESIEGVTDYPFRAYVLRNEFVSRIMSEARKIDYDNFKNSVTDDRPYEEFLLDTWSASKYLTDYEELDDAQMSDL